MIHKQLTNAMFPDVCHLDGKLYIAYMADSQVNIGAFDLADGSFSIVYQTSCSNQGFPRIRAVDGKIWLIFRPGDGLSIVVKNYMDGVTYTKLGTFFNWPVTLSESGYNINDMTPGVYKLSTFKYDDSFLVATASVPGTGLAFGRVSNDDNRGTETKFGMVNPQYAEELFCGEAFEGGVVVVDDPTESKKVFLDGQTTYVPKICKYGDKWAIVTSDYNRPLQLFYDISRADIIGNNPAYNPKADLIGIRDQLNVVIDKL